jgi:hypothetical protein
MATRTRPFVVTGAALASAAAVVMATPDLVSTRDLSIASAPSPTRLSTANYELTALADITVQGISDAYWFGWGGYVGCGDVNAQGQCTYTPQDTYYPGVNQVYASGVSGVLYYLIDNAVDQFTPDFDLDNYFFEIGWLNGGYPNATYSGVGSLFYVGAGELFGTDSPIFQVAKTVFYYGITNVINQTIVTLATALVPEITLGPVTVGGGILASLYYYGQTPDQSFQANSNGLPAIWAYISTALTGLLPTAAATPSSASATTLAAAAESATDEVTGAVEAKSGVGALKSSAAPVTEVAAPAVDAAPADPPKAVTAPAATDTPVVDAPAADASTTGAPAADSSVSGSSVSDSPVAGAPAADSPAADAPATDTKPVAKPAKPKAQSPLGKLTGKIRSALGAGNGGGKHRADASTSSSSSGDSGSDASSTGK